MWQRLLTFFFADLGNLKEPYPSFFGEAVLGAQQTQAATPHSLVREASPATLPMPLPPYLRLGTGDPSEKEQAPACPKSPGPIQGDATEIM